MDLRNSYWEDNSSLVGMIPRTLLIDLESLQIFFILKVMALDVFLSY